MEKDGKFREKEEGEKPASKDESSIADKVEPPKDDKKEAQ